MKKLLIINLFLVVALQFTLAQTTINQKDANGKKQGLWEEKTSSGSSKGNYLNDQKEGNWLSYGSNGNLTRIEAFSKGLREGIYVEIDQRGYLVSEMYYVNNQLDGTAKKFYYGTNPASVIDYKQGKIHGKKKEYYENAAGKIKEESTYTDDQKDGPSNFFASNGDPIAEYIYVKGSLEGVQKSYYPGKKLMSEQNYVNNIESGLYKEYYENGKVKMEGNYKEGKMDGRWVEYSEDGKISAEGMYLNGEKEGKWTEYDASGKAHVKKFVKGVEGK